MAKSSVYQGPHAVGKVIFLEEVAPIDLAIQKGVEAEDRGSPIRHKNGPTRCAQLLDAHGNLVMMTANS